MKWSILITMFAPLWLTISAAAAQDQRLDSPHQSLASSPQPPSARGVLRAEHEAVLASTISARIVDMPYAEGDPFEKGAVLVKFDCSQLEARLSAARSAAAAESRNVQVQQELLSLGATGRADLDIARLKLSQQASEVEAIRQEMAGCEITAPFSGHVVEPLVRSNETPPANERLIHVVSDGPLELHMVVPSCWLRWLRQGTTFDFDVDETGEQLDAEVTRIAAAVDPVSQTVKIISRINEVPTHVLPGMSGTASWPEDAQDLDRMASCSVTHGQVQ